MGCICCTGGMCFGSAEELSGLKLGPVSFKDPDVMPREASVFKGLIDPALSMKDIHIFLD